MYMLHSVVDVGMWRPAMGEHFTRFSVRSKYSTYKTRHYNDISHSLVREDPDLIDAPVD